MVGNSDITSGDSFWAFDPVDTDVDTDHAPYGPSQTVGHSSSSIYVDVGSNITPVRHGKFFLEDHTVMVQVGQILFSVHRSFLARDSVYFRKVLDQAQPGNPVVLEGVDPADFERLLESLYPDCFGEFSLSTEAEWTSVLHLAVQFEFHSIRALAIRRLLPLVSPVNKILLGRKYSIEEWPRDGLVELCDVDYQGGQFMITLQDARRLGLDLEAALKIAHIRNEYSYMSQQKTVREVVELAFDVVAFSKWKDPSDVGDASQQHFAGSEHLVAPIAELPIQDTNAITQGWRPMDSRAHAVPSEAAGLTITSGVSSLAEVAPDWLTAITRLLPLVSFSPSHKHYKVAAREIVDIINSTVHTMSDLQRVTEVIVSKALDGSIETLDKPLFIHSQAPGTVTRLCAELAERISLNIPNSGLFTPEDDDATADLVDAKETTSSKWFKLSLYEACRNAVATWETGPSPPRAVVRQLGMRTPGSFSRQVQVILLLEQLVRKTLVPPATLALCVDTVRAKVDDDMCPMEDLDRTLCVLLETGEALDQAEQGKDAMDTLFSLLKELRTDKSYASVHGRIEGLLDLRNTNWP